MALGVVARTGGGGRLGIPEKSGESSISGRRVAGMNGCARCVGQRQRQRRGWELMRLI